MKAAVPAQGHCRVTKAPTPGAVLVRKVVGVQVGRSIAWPALADKCVSACPGAASRWVQAWGCGEPMRQSCSLATRGQRLGPWSLLSISPMH